LEFEFVEKAAGQLRWEDENALVTKGGRKVQKKGGEREREKKERERGSQL
jgi:hypothetical protein